MCVVAPTEQVGRQPTVGRGIVEASEAGEPGACELLGSRLLVVRGKLIDDSLSHLGIQASTTQCADRHPPSRTSALELVSGKVAGELLVVDQAHGFQVVERARDFLVLVSGTDQSPRQLGPASGPMAEEAEGAILRRAPTGRHRASLSRPVPVPALS